MTAPVICQRCERDEKDCACIGGPFVVEPQPERSLFLPSTTSAGADVDARGFVWGGLSHTHKFDDPDAECPWSPWDAPILARDCDLCSDRACSRCTDFYDCVCDTDERHANSESEAA